MQSLRHVLERLAKLAKAGGVYVDVYFALSVLELAFGGLLQRIPKLLPVVQTTVSKSGHALPCVRFAGNILLEALGPSVRVIFQPARQGFLEMPREMAT